MLKLRHQQTAKFFLSFDLRCIPHINAVWYLNNILHSFIALDKKVIKMVSTCDIASTEKLEA